MPTTTLQMVFRNEEGRTVTLSVNDPIEPVDEMAISQVMDEVITKNVFGSSGGDLVEKVAARLVARQVTPII